MKYLLYFGLILSIVYTFFATQRALNTVCLHLNAEGWDGRLHSYDSPGCSVKSDENETDENSGRDDHPERD